MTPTRNDKLVAESNELINAKMNLGLEEQRIFLIGLMQIDKDDHDLETYYIPISAIRDLFPSAGESIYSRVKVMENDLAESFVGIPSVTKQGKRKYTTYPLYRKISYVEGEGHLTIGFNPDLKPFLIHLQGNFTLYAPRYLAHFRSRYSFRIYKLLKQWEDFGKKSFDLAYLHEIMDLPKTYRNYGRMNERVLAPTTKDINDFSDLHVRYLPVKEGRRYGGVTFYITPKREIEFSPETAANKARTQQRSTEVQPLVSRVAQPSLFDADPLAETPFDSWWESLSEAERIEFRADAARCVDKGGEELSEQVREGQIWYLLHMICLEQIGATPPGSIADERSGAAS